MLKENHDLKILSVFIWIFGFLGYEIMPVYANYIKFVFIKFFKVFDEKNTSKNSKSKLFSKGESSFFALEVPGKQNERLIKHVRLKQRNQIFQK